MEGSVEGTYQYPHQKWEDYAPAPKPTADLRELARSYLLSAHGSDQPVPTDEIARNIAEKYSELQYNKGERWEKSLKERLRTFYCFSGHTQKGSRVIRYACDPTVDPTLKRVQQKRKQGSSSVTPGPSNRTQSPPPELDSPAPIRPKKRRKKADKPLLLALNLPSPAPELPPIAPEAEQVPVQQNDIEAVAVQDPEEDVDTMKLGPITPLPRLEPVHHATIEDASEPPDQPTANGFSFDTSIVFEYKDRNLESSTFYGMQCGPYIIKRRRRDSQFPLAPLLKLVRLAFGPKVKGEAAQKLVDQEEEDDLASMLLSKRTISYASLAHVRALAEECNLLPFLSPLLSDDLLDLPESHPISRPIPAGIFAKDLICRYCDHACISKSELRRHQIVNAGACQLDQARHSSTYQTLLEADIGTIQKRQHGQSDDFSFRHADLAHSSEFQLVLQEQQEAEKATKCEGSSLQPSLLYWSPAEKERFFFALERSSRFRPDMIADHVKTKTIGEVSAYLSLLEDGLSLLDSAGSDFNSQPAAREMSEKWIANEETLASDVAVWEIFTTQASQIPWEKRDFAQLAALQQPGRAHCEQCPRGACDAAWPTCGRCTDRGQPCHWIRGFHPQALPKHLGHIKAALAPLSKVPAPLQEQDATILRTSMMQSLSWHQLLALSYQQNDDQGLPIDVERTWSAEALQSATSERAEKKGFTRKALSQSLQEAGMTSLPSERKERIYKAIKRDQKQDETKSLPTAAELRQYDRTENLKAKRSIKNVNIKKALRWQDLPISDSSDTRWQKKKELAGIQDEIHLAARQLHLTGMRVDALGPTAEIFDLGKIALLLDLHRLGSDDDGCIAKAAIDVLYDILNCYVRKVVAAAVNLLEARHASEEWSNKLKRKCMEEAIAQCKPARTGAKDNTLNLNDPFEPPCIDWYSESTFSAFGGDLDIIPSGEFGDTDLTVEDRDSQDLSCSEDDDNAEEEEEEVEFEKKVDEKDQLEDHLYEERLWMLFKARDKRDEAEADEDQDEEEDEEDQRERMNLEENDDEDEGAEEEEDRRRSEVETTDIGEETEDGLITNDDDDGPSDDDERRDEGQGSDAELPQMPERAAEKGTIVRERTKQPKKPKIGNSNTGSSAKQIFKSQEFISTSDEDEL